MRRVVLTIVVSLCAAGIAAAQPSNRSAAPLNVDGGGRADVSATVTADAPIFLLPNTQREPLRVAKAGSVLRVVKQEGEWCNVEFQDPQVGRRSGYIQTRFIEVRRRNQEPMDLSIRDEEPARPQPVRQDEPSRPRDRARQPAPSSGLHPQVREGFWFNAGLGYGTLGCDNCTGRADSFSGGLVFGGKLSDKWLLGVGTTGWTKSSAFGDRLTVGTLDARFRFYPVLTSGFFITGGLGLGDISVDSDTEYGTGAVLGLGWDIRVGKNVSLTPFWNGFAVRTSSADANVGQLGLGITLH